MSKIEEQLHCGGMTPRDIKNTAIVNLWALVWALSLALLIHLVDAQWLQSSAWLLLGFIVHSVIGVALLFSYKRFISQADELERKIQLDALAIAAGVVIISFSSYSVLENADFLPPLKPAYLIAILSLAYCAGIIMGRRNFR